MKLCRFTVWTLDQFIVLIREGNRLDALHDFIRPLKIFLTYLQLYSSYCIAQLGVQRDRILIYQKTLNTLAFKLHTKHVSIDWIVKYFDR